MTEREKFETWYYNFDTGAYKVTRAMMKFLAFEAWNERARQELPREEIARLFSQLTSEKKKKSSAENGKKGGRPKKT